jgi:hypothetical protein
VRGLKDERRLRAINRERNISNGGVKAYIKGVVIVIKTKR